MVDGDFVLSESRPCATYLVDKYAPDDKLYPKDPQIRSRVDQRLYFDMGSFYANFAQCVVSHQKIPDEAAFISYSKVSNSLYSDVAIYLVNKSFYPGWNFTLWGSF